MSVKAKYQDVLTLGEKLGIKDGKITEENGCGKIGNVGLILRMNMRKLKLL